MAKTRSWHAPTILVLCLCILLQMLGVPVTLLEPDSSFDAVGASILEGFSVPPSPIDLTLSPDKLAFADQPALLHISILAFAPFHPPLV